MVNDELKGQKSKQIKKILLCTAKYRTFVKNIVMEPLSANKNERVELRISSYDKRIFQKAQKLSGDKSFSSFIIRIVKEQSEEIVAKKDRIISSERDRKRFFDAVFGSSKPNQNLVEAAERYKSKSKLK